jgi:hypothetical protein
MGFKEEDHRGDWSCSRHSSREQALNITKCQQRHMGSLVVNGMKSGYSHFGRQSGSYSGSFFIFFSTFFSGGNRV